MHLICPQCNQPLDESDYNISTDIAYCRTCDVKYSLATLSSVEALDDQTFENFKRSYADQFAREAKVAVPFHKSMRIISFACIAGLVVFAVVIGVMLEWEIGGIFSEMGMVLGAVFLVMVVTELPIAYVFGAGKYRVSVDRGLLKVRTGASPFCQNKQIEITRDSVIRMEKNPNCRVNNEPVDQITVETDGQKVQFGIMMHKTNKTCLIRWIAEQIR